MTRGKILYIVTILLCGFQPNAQVHLQTGAAQYSVPLYDYQDMGNRIGTSVSLFYISGNGIRANDVTTSVGAGWGLDFGGVITRIQNGEPDDQKQDGSFPDTYMGGAHMMAGYNNYRTNYYPDGFMYSSYDPAVPVDNGGGYSMILPNNYFFDYMPLPEYLADREQDQYMFSFGGYQGYFVIGKNQEVKLLVDSKLKVEFVTSNMTSSNIITRISEFHITDPTGIQYIFKDKELSHVMQYKLRSPSDVSQFEIFYPGTSPSQVNSFITGDPKDWLVTSKWYLSEIHNPLTGSKILFEYGDFSIDIHGARSGYRAVADSRSNITLQVERKKGLLKRIKKIKCSSKEEVRFVYAHEHRKDLTFDSALSRVDIVYDNVIKNSWNFTYGYLVDEEVRSYSESLTSIEAYRARLCLLELGRSTPNSTETIPPYVFDYYIGEYTYTVGGQSQTVDLKLAPPFTFYQDSWGFPNLWAFTDDDLDKPIDDLDYSNIDWGMVWAYAEAALGRRNVYGRNGMAGLLKSVKNPTGGQQTFEFEHNVATLSNGDQKSVGGYRVNKIILYDGISHDNDIVHEYYYQKLNGQSSGWGYEEPVYQKTVEQRIYDCDENGRPGQIILKVASALPSLTQRNGITLSVNNQSLFIDQSRGIRTQALNSLIINLVISFFLDLLSPNYVDHTSTIQSYYSSTENNPLPFQYSRVVVEKKLGEESVGNTEYTYTSSENFAIDVPTLAVSNSKKPRYAFWAYGHPLSVLTNDKDGNPVTKTDYTYSLLKSTLTNSDFVSQKWEPTRTTYDCDVTPGTGLGSDLIAHDIYYPMYGRIELVEKKDYVYNELGESKVVTNNFEYSQTHFQLTKAITSNSREELVETNIYYATDYTVSGVLQTMNNAATNMATMPVATQTIITKAGNNKYLLNGSVTEYGFAANGDIKPVKNYVARMSEPVSASQATFSPTVILPGTDLYEPVSETIYTLNGMPATAITESGKISTLYDYENKLPIAMVQNADISNIAYTSFESDGGGGWTFNPLKISTEYSVTGRRCLKAGFADGGTTISKNISDERQYLLSFWLKGELPFFAGSEFHLRKSYLNEATGFTYYEYLVSNGNSISMTNLGGSFPAIEYKTFLLDEIRLYPVEALMSTITYDPAWGKTAESDVNGRITYYEYDVLGRMKLVMDQDRNVIKTFEYNYKQ